MYFVFSCIHTYIYKYIYLFIYLFIYLYIYIYIYIYLFIYSNIDIYVYRVNLRSELVAAEQQVYIMYQLMFRKVYFLCIGSKES